MSATGGKADEAPTVKQVRVCPICNLKDNCSSYSNRKGGKESSRHLGRKVLEQSQRPWHVAVAQMHERKVKGAKAPVRHDFDEASITHEPGLNDRRQVADAPAGQKSSCQADIVIHREVRLERDRLLALAIGIE